MSIPDIPEARGRSQSLLDQPIPPEDDIRCEACDEDEEDTLPGTGTLHFCYACQFVFCDNCWKAQLPHRRKSQAASMVVHEKTNPWVAKKVHNAIHPPADEKTYARLCMQDEQTAWFGIERQDQSSEQVIFHDTGRYAELMAATKNERRSRRLSWKSESSIRFPDRSSRDTRTPSLVSFVGQSGAGKSTLISLLIAFQGISGGNAKLPSPVVGMSGKDLPTSEDVHLYLEPSSFCSENPVLFADCEGLDGGEREPVKSRVRKDKSQRILESRKSTIPDSSTKVRYFSERELVWADSAERRSRQFAVTHLYPRLLFTFSDTIVFVLKNPRVIEGVFERLIEWAAAALETSSNQPVLPCAIVALNATEINIDEELWDVEASTKQLLESLAETVHRNAAFQRYAEFWKARNRDIRTLEQLVLSYYSSIQIVRIPAAGRPKLIHEQIEKLYNAIDAGCNVVRERKRALRMLLDAGELQSYLQCAFDHFASTLDVAFDFVQASFINNPIPLDFGGNILRLAINIMDRKTSVHGRPNPREIFEEISAMVASCIMLDSVRHDIRGNAERIFPEYLSHLDTALEEFCDRHWPCEFVLCGAEYPLLLRHLDGITAHRNLQYVVKQSHCVNVRAGHGSKGHQTKAGTVFAVGDYHSEFTFESYQAEFQNAVYFKLHELMKDLEERTRQGEPHEATAAAMHRDGTLASFYGKDSNPSLVQSHSVCLCCLFERPEHVLPCGHILCTACVKSYGKAKSNTLVEIPDCPIEAATPGRVKPCTVYLRPESAGSRVLSLDGGGIRAVVQLEILRLLEAEWKGLLPIRHFFDLIIGTGTGGLIALGLGTRNWTLEKCALYLERICNEAYAPRPGRKIPGLRRLLSACSRSKYDTPDLELALKGAYSEAQSLFGGKSAGGAPTSAVKAAVTATTSAGTPVLFANYNRRCDQLFYYQFCRPDKLDHELRVWEAARATMATPKLFKPYRHAPSKQMYTAAEQLHQNPIVFADKERQLLYPTNEQCERPDLILSLGTGLEATEPILSDRSSIRSVAPSVVESILTLSSRSRNDPMKRAASPTRCQMISDDFSASLPESASQPRLVRFNPISMVSLPAADDLSRMKRLQTLARAHIDAQEIKKIAAKLMATLFYFELAESALPFERTNGATIASGLIHCRLPHGMPEVANLGKLIKEKSIIAPTFIACERDRSAQTFEITAEMIEEMIVESAWRMPPINISTTNRHALVDIALSLDGDEAYPISGFPRKLVNVETRAAKHRRALQQAQLSGTIKTGSGSSIYSRSSKPWSPPLSDRNEFGKSSSSVMPSDPASISSASGLRSPTTNGSDAIQTVPGNDIPNMPISPLASSGEGRDDPFRHPHASPEATDPHLLPSIPHLSEMVFPQPQSTPLTPRAFQRLSVSPQDSHISSDSGLKTSARKLSGSAATLNDQRSGYRNSDSTISLDTMTSSTGPFELDVDQPPKVTEKADQRHREPMYSIFPKKSEPVTTQLPESLRIRSQFLRNAGHHKIGSPPPPYTVPTTTIPTRFIGADKLAALGVEQSITGLPKGNAHGMSRSPITPPASPPGPFSTVSIGPPSPLPMHQLPAQPATANASDPTEVKRLIITTGNLLPKDEALYSANSDLIQGEEDMPMEMRLRKLESLVRQLQVEKEAGGFGHARVEMEG